MVQNKEYIPVQLSQFNSAAQGISRCHEIKLKCIEYRRKGNLAAWNYELDNFWLELCGDKNLAKTSPNAINKMKQFWENYAQAQKNRAKTYLVLLEKEQWLRILEDRLGKGNKYQKEDDSGI
jgi:hypothetical protein